MKRVAKNHIPDKTLQGRAQCIGLLCLHGTHAVLIPLLLSVGPA